MPETARHPAARFSDRAEDYVKYRPHYSPEVVQGLQQDCGLRPDHLIADVGCGTGLLAKIFLENGNRVIGVEPNREMRRAGEEHLAGYASFRMLDGSAETTTLSDSSVDFVVAGQAFHWFRPDETRAEFARILKPGGWTVLIWHDRNLDSTPFLRAYEDLVRRHSVDYERVSHKWVATYNALHEFFAPNEMNYIQQQNQQQLDCEGLRGRLLSSSYMPKSGKRYEAMLRELPQLFSSSSADGRVILQYDTKIYFGHLD